MSQIYEQRDDQRPQRAGGYAFGGAAVGIALLLGGCITVKAPEKPIEINLNVKVQQEVVVRLQKDAQDLIQNNPELFPQ